MNVAIYIKEGRTQLVLTPTTDFEKGIVSKVGRGEQKVSIYTGEFYDCQGGWTRQGNMTDKSLIIVLDTEGK